MKTPKGLEDDTKVPSEKALKLNNSIYGLVQAALQWNTPFEEEILRLGYVKIVQEAYKQGKKKLRREKNSRKVVINKLFFTEKMTFQSASIPNE